MQEKEEKIILPAEELKVTKQGEEVITLHTNGIEHINPGKISQGSDDPPCLWCSPRECNTCDYRRGYWIPSDQALGAKKCNDVINDLTKDLK